jgi:hypothetical protein
MIVLVSSRTKTFPFNDKNESYITVKVDELVYITGKSYYDIKYDCTDVHPEFPGLTDVLEGVVVLKNKMTEIMVDYVLSDSEELVKVSGTSSAQHYRYLTMINLSKLCD